jgi:hypothetical protein
MLRDIKVLRAPIASLLWLLFHLVIANGRCGAQQPLHPNITPDAKIQATINRVIMAKDENDKETREAMNELTEMARLKPETLAPQLIYYKINVKGEKEGLASIGMMGYFTRMWSSEMRKALIPFLEAEDERIPREVGVWLGNVDNRLAITGKANLMAYRETLLRQKESPPRGLVAYVFAYPGHALLLFGDIYSEKPKFGEFPRDLMWSDHVVTTVQWRLVKGFIQDGDLEKAREELDKLSRHQAWYARRYVTEVVREAPKLGTPEIINLLKKDAHPLVNESARLIK